MDDLVIRNIKPELLKALGERAAAHGRSPEEEAQSMLAAALGTTGEQVGSPGWVEQMYHRALERTGGRVLPTSADLIAEGRDERG